MFLGKFWEKPENFMVKAYSVKKLCKKVQQGGHNVPPPSRNRVKTIDFKL